MIYLNQIFQRIISIFLYTYPLNGSKPFGDYLFLKYNFLNELIFFLTIPINIIEGIFKYGGLGVFSGLLIFLILFAGVVKNPKIPYFVRYNACQSILLYIALNIIAYLFNIISFPFSILISFVFVVSFTLFIFSVVQCIYGVEPEIPFISKSVRMQI